MFFLDEEVYLAVSLLKFELLSSLSALTFKDTFFMMRFKCRVKMKRKIRHLDLLEEIN